MVSQGKFYKMDKGRDNQKIDVMDKEAKNQKKKLGKIEGPIYWYWKPWQSTQARRDPYNYGLIKRPH